MNTEINKKSIVVVGPTAVGKTEYSIKIANKYGGEIVSADSMQIYKGFDIGSAKPSSEELSLAKHHLIDIIDPKVDFSVAEYQNLATKVVNDLFSTNTIPVICGGTGLYINSLVYDMDFSKTKKQDNLRKKLEREADLLGNDHLHKVLERKDPDAANRLHPNNVKRVIRALEIIETSDGESSLRSFEESFKPNKLMNPIIIFLNRDREELYERIDLRVDVLIENGLIDEVRGLKESGLSNEHISMKGIGYKEIAGYIDGEYDMTEAIYLTKRNSRRYAKRQITWFKRYSSSPGSSVALNTHEFNLSKYNSKEEALNTICKVIDTFLYS